MLVACDSAKEEPPPPAKPPAVEMVAPAAPGAGGTGHLDRRSAHADGKTRAAHAGGVQQDVLFHRQGAAARHHLRFRHGTREAAQCHQQGSFAADPRHVHTGGAQSAAAVAGGRGGRHRHRRTHGHSRTPRAGRFHRTGRRQHQRDPGDRSRCRGPRHRRRVVRASRLRAAFEQLLRKPRGVEQAPRHTRQEAGGYPAGRGKSRRRGHPRDGERGPGRCHRDRQLRRQFLERDIPQDPAAAGDHAAQQLAGRLGHSQGQPRAQENARCIRREEPHGHHDRQRHPQALPAEHALGQGRHQVRRT